MSSETDFERRARELLSESLTHVNSAVRSRLTTARHEAAAAAARQPRSLLGIPLSGFAPAAGAIVAAFAVAVVLWAARPVQLGMGSDSAVAAFEDASLLTDNDGLEMVEDADASFYEWAVP